MIEAWAVEWATLDGASGGFVRIARHHDEHRMWCWLYLVDASGVVAVRDHDVPWARDDHLLARSDALWCEMICEVPGEHWAVNAEAFGVRLDDPDDAWRGEIGVRVPVGLELDFEGTSAVVAHEQGERQIGTVRGDVLLGADAFFTDAQGEWSYERTATPSFPSTATARDIAHRVVVPLDATRALERGLARTGDAHRWAQRIVVRPTRLSAG